MGFVKVEESGDTFNVRIRKLAGVVQALDPLSKKDNINFGTVEAPRPNVDPTQSYWRTISGSLNALLPSAPGGTADKPVVGFSGLKRL